MSVGSAASRYQRSRAIGPYVYVCFDALGSVIYVGRSHTTYRLEFHRSQKVWWSEVDRVRIRRRSSYADSLVLEALLIRRHQPKYNRSGVTR